MKISSLIFFMLLVVSGFSQKSIYDYKVSSVNGSEIDFNDFRGKLIVVVNIASGSDRNKQLIQLNTLCQSYASKGLVVVAFPSDDFKNEPKSNEDIRAMIKGLHQNIIVAGKTTSRGTTNSSIYQWFTQKTNNGTMDMEVKGDFQKFIISREGKIVGVFSGLLSPVEEPFIKAINANLNN